MQMGQGGAAIPQARQVIDKQEQAEDLIFDLFRLKNPRWICSGLLYTNYFGGSHELIPSFPQQDPQVSCWLFVGTLGQRRPWRTCLFPDSLYSRDSDDDDQRHADLVY